MSASQLAPGLPPNVGVDEDLRQNRQSVLLLQGPRERYVLTNNYPIPSLRDDAEVLVRTEVIGLNPIDWKAPDFNFGIPQFPYISGRELVGTVSRSHAASRFKPGNRVIAISTDYRDARKAAYQEFVVALSYNIVKLPTQVSSEQGAAMGVAFITAAFALGSCFGLSFSNVLGGPDLKALIQSVEAVRIPKDVRYEALESIEDHETALEGDWVAIWGGSANSAYLSIQLARLAGLKVAVIVDQARHGYWLSTDSHARPDLLIDNSSPDRAVEVLLCTIGDRLHFGIDTSGEETASLLAGALQRAGGRSTTQTLSPPATPPARKTSRRAHVIGLAGLPKPEYAKDLQVHSVPLKLFHQVPEVGRALTEWMERLLHTGQLRPPRILGNHFGLAEMNNALHRMRNGEIRGGKLVVTV